MRNKLVANDDAGASWNYSEAFLGDVNTRYNPGGVMLALRRLASENGDFDSLVKGFMRERSHASWFFNAPERVRSTLLAKTNSAARKLERSYSEHGFAIDRLREAVGVEPFTAWDYAQCWPLLPYQVDALNRVVGGLAGSGGVPLYYQGGRGAIAIADRVVGSMRGAPSTAMAPAWRLYDAYMCPGFEAANPIARLERQRVAGVMAGTEIGEASRLDALAVFKALVLAPMLAEIPATAVVIAALMADDVRVDLAEAEQQAALVLDSLVAAGFAERRGDAYAAKLDTEPGSVMLSDVREVFGVPVV